MSDLFPLAEETRRAELEAANAQGQITHQPEFVEFTNVASTKTRDEVRQEAMRTANRAQ